MIFGVGWCVLRTSRNALCTATVGDAEIVDTAIDEADAELWTSFKLWMSANESPLLLWSLHEHHNNHHGLLQIYLSRNHRYSPFWDMLSWIAQNGQGSYGLFYVHDDEEFAESAYGRSIPEDYYNVFRVHRIMNGRLEELADPFFGPIIPNLEPIHPYDRQSEIP